MELGSRGGLQELQFYFISLKGGTQDVLGVQCLVSVDGAGACLRSPGWAPCDSRALFLLGVAQVEPPIKHAPRKGSGQAVRSPWEPAQAMAELWFLSLACLAASLLPAARSARSGQGEPWGGAAPPAPIPLENLDRSSLIWSWSWFGCPNHPSRAIFLRG